MWTSARRLTVNLLALLLGLTLAGAAPARPAAAATHHPHRVSFDHYSLSVDGKRVYLWSGEFHYWRLPSPDLWRDVLQKLKAAGFNATSIYFDWGYHSPAPGVYDFSGVRDVDRLLDIAAEVGIWVIARPGPYINAETDAGGFPGWLLTQQGRARSSAPDYTAAYRQWLSRIDPIIARHQVTNGTGSVLLYQVENEYGFNGDPAYMTDLQQQAHAHGITVPITHNYCCGPFAWNAGPGAVPLVGFDSYPQGFDCSNPTRWAGVGTLFPFGPDMPVFTPEYQGGSFDPWGGPGYDKCRQLTGPDFEKVYYKNNLADGATMQNFYMTYGGTSWGWLPDPNQVYTSYDYGAAISEDRQLTAKYDELKRQGYLVTTVAPLTKTDPAGTAPTTDPDVQATVRVNPDDQTHFFVLRHADSTSTATDDTHLTIDGYPSVPQEPGTAIRLAGRDSKTLVAGYRLGAQRLQYSTSEILTHARIGDRDVAVLYGRQGEAGETVLRYPDAPHVTVLSGAVRSAWDAGRHDLRLNYTHDGAAPDGLARVLVTPAHGTPLLLLLGTDEAAARFWREDTPSGPVLVRGPELVRTADTGHGVLALTGDTDAATPVEIWAAPGAARQVRWNGAPVAVHRGVDKGPGGSLVGALAGPRPVTLPALTGWRQVQATPEADPAFDDSRWVRADHLTTNNPTPPGTLPVLYADDYGFHHGDVWYRGRFTATGTETAADLSAITGRAGVWSAWLGGVFLGSTGDPRHRFAFPAGALRPGSTNVLSVLVENMGHNEDFFAGDSQKEPRGLTGATLVGSPAALDWRIQGSTGNDPVRGPMNTGGQYGERTGYHLPGYPDGGWDRVSLPHPDGTPGTSWYRATVDLDLPPGQDVPLGIRITDDPARHYRALIYVNGWLIGRYINDVGPQRSFPVPPGILRTDGRNTIAIAVWNTDTRTGGLGRVTLDRYGNHATSLRVRS
jgi:beta-galactosidase GanA